MSAKKMTSAKKTTRRKPAAPATEPAPDYAEGSGTSLATANDTTPPPAPTDYVAPERQDAPAVAAPVSVELGNVVQYVTQTDQGTVTGCGVILSDADDTYVIAKLELVTVPADSVITEPVG